MRCSMMKSTFPSSSLKVKMLNSQSSVIGVLISTLSLLISPAQATLAKPSLKS